MAATHRPSGVFATLTKNGDGSYTLLTKDQVTLAFDSSGRLVSLTDRNGNQTTLAYDGSGPLTSVSDCVGRTHQFHLHVRRPRGHR